MHSCTTRGPVRSPKGTLVVLERDFLVRRLDGGPECCASRGDHGQAVIHGAAMALHDDMDQDPEIVQGPPRRSRPSVITADG